MDHKHRFIFLSCVASLIALPSLAATPPAFTIQSAVNEALSKNPDVLKAQEATNQAKQDFYQAISKIFPTINATGTAEHLKDAASKPGVQFNGSPYNQYSLGLSLTQPLYDGGAILAGYGFTKKQEEINSYALDIAQRTASESVLESFYSILLNQKQLQILQETYEVDKKTLVTAERYYRIGRAQEIDVLQLKTQTALLPPQIAQAQSALQTAASQLATLIRDLDANQIEVKGRLVNPDPKWVKQMLAKRAPELPEVLQARATVDQFEDNRSVQMAPNWPSLAFVGNIGRTTTTKTDLFNENTTNWSIGLQLTVPLFSGLSSVFQRNSLASQEKQLEYTETKTSDTVSLNQIQTEKNLETAQTALDSSREAAIYGRQSKVAAERDYRLQNINYLQYQTSLQAYLTAETGYNQAKYNYIVAVAQYFNAAGVPISVLISKLDELSSQPAGANE